MNQVILLLTGSAKISAPRIIMPNLVGILLSLFSISLQANDSSLTKFLSSTKTLQAEFKQRVMDDSGSILELTKGDFYLSRPGKFRWDYKSDSGFSEQVDQSISQQIVADGKSIFVFDADLEQVTVREFANALSQVPSLLLAYEGADLEKYFDIEQAEIADKNDVLWVVLTPTSEEASYQQLRIGLLDNNLAEIYLLDGLGNQTHLTFSKVQKNKQLKASLFDFEVPEGADVLTE